MKQNRGECCSSTTLGGGTGLLDGYRPIHAHVGVAPDTAYERERALLTGRERRRTADAWIGGDPEPKGPTSEVVGNRPLVGERDRNGIALAHGESGGIE